MADVAETDQSEQRRTVDVTLPKHLLEQARVFDLDVSQACERGLSAEVSVARSRRWLAENRASLDAWNQHVEVNGLPLAQFRQF